MLRMVSYRRRPQSGHITCYLNRTYHVLPTTADSGVDRSTASRVLELQGKLRRNHRPRSASEDMKKSIVVLCLLWFLSAVPGLHGRERNKKENFGQGFSTEMSAPESQVLEAVDAVVNDGMIQGTKEYNKDKFIEKAYPAESSPSFPQWTEPGKVFYKVREKVLAP